MNKKSLLAIFFILLVILSILSILIVRRNDKMRKKINNILYLEFSYSVGYAMEANTIYKIDCNNKCEASIKHTGSSEIITKEIDNDTVLNIKNMLNNYNVSSWNNFSKSNKHVLDGNSFHFYLKTDEESISASGYESWPKNYKSVKNALDSIFNDIEYNRNINNNCNGDVDYKPIIYLYPEDKTDITVKLGYREKITISYPEYDDGWEVIAHEDGTLIEKKSGKKLYSLFWEGINTESNDIKKDGFVVKGSDAVKFLEEKLTILGLNDKEKEEFIIYWLPKLKDNDYNYIRFESMDEQNRNMPLIINPKPDTIIRINMEIKPLHDKIKVKEQVLNEVERHGFTVVEWGGTILSENKIN